MKQKRFFASDNCAAAHPHIAQVLSDQGGHLMSYGDDEYSKEALATLRELFGIQSSAFFVYNGTAANVLAIRSLLTGYEAVIAPRTAHLGEDECGSLEAIAGLKIEHIPHELGKIQAGEISSCLSRRGFVHSVQPRLLSITQSNELGQVYSVEEMQTIGRLCREHDLFFHVDGARIANAVAFLLMKEEPDWAGLSSIKLIQGGREILAALTVDAGVHALSLGGTKNGLMFGEGIILMNGAQNNKDLPFYRKQATQLASKMRYISVQFQELYRGDLWLRNALNANRMACRLEAGICQLIDQCNFSQVEAVPFRILYPVQANAVFVTMPCRWADSLQPQYRFYPWGKDSYRFMCSWDTTAEDVDGFIVDLTRVIEEVG